MRLDFATSLFVCLHNQGKCFTLTLTVKKLVEGFSTNPSTVVKEKGFPDASSIPTLWTVPGQIRGRYSFLLSLHHTYTQSQELCTFYALSKE